MIKNKLNQAKHNGDDDLVAKIILEDKPSTSDDYDLAINSFNLSIKNIQINMEAAEWLNENSHLASSFSTIIRASLLSNNIKLAKEDNESNNDDSPSVEFKKV